MSDDYYALMGKRTRLTPMLTFVSGPEHEAAVLRGTALPDGEIISCGNSYALPSGKRPDGKDFRHVYFDFTQAGEIFVTQKTKDALDDVASGSVEYYPCKMSFMQSEETFYIIKVRGKMPVVDYDNSDCDDDEEFFTSVSFESDFLEQTPLEDRLIFKLIEVGDHIVVHASVLDALNAAGVSGFHAYPLKTWNSNPSKNPELIKMGEHYYAADAIG